MNIPAWVVKDVKPQRDYSLIITFQNNEIRRYDAKQLLNKPIFAPLKNISFFMLAHPACDTVAWTDEIDIAPERLYECSQPVSE